MSLTDLTWGLAGGVVVYIFLLLVITRGGRKRQSKKQLPIINEDGSYETDQSLIDIVNDVYKSGSSIFREFDENGQKNH